ncbi:CdaR family protein [Paenibacillus harenae]|uniref:CdaR family protein n=1 Tax=Paenibacillus harenae TaxID=306543 RepID=UPI0003FFE9A1|nr:CdaR family protein [Paenibacillus harenae]
MDKWLSHPTALKIISVILGLLLWAVVHIDPELPPQTVTTSIDTKIIEAAKIIPVGYDEEKFALTAMEPTVVRIVVEGKISDLLAAASIEDYPVTVDLKDVKPGLQELPLILDLPKGIQLVEMSPRTVTVQLEEILTKPYELQIAVNGKPADGFIAGTPTLIAPIGEVQVTLPKDDMSRIGLVATELTVEGADKTVVNKKAKVVVYDTEGVEMTNAIVSPETVHAEVRVTPPFKSVPLQVRYTGALPEGLSLVSVKPAVNEVTVYGDQKSLDGLQVYDGAVLDLSKMKESGTVQVKTQLVDGIRIIEPAEIDVDVVLAPIVTRNFTGIPVIVEGEAAGQSAKFRSPADGKFSLTVSGAESVISKLTSNEIRIVASVAGLKPGVHDVPLQVDVPAYVQIVLGNADSLNVSIEIVDNVPADAGQEEQDEPVQGTPSEPPDPAPNPGDTFGEDVEGAGGSNANGV